jgi:hypothetical protein
VIWRRDIIALRLFIAQDAARPQGSLGSVGRVKLPHGVHDVDLNRILTNI